MTSTKVENGFFFCVFIYFRLRALHAVDVEYSAFLLDNYTCVYLWLLQQQHDHRISNQTWVRLAGFILHTPMLQ